MNLETLDWDDELLGVLQHPAAMLPEIRPSSDPNGYGTTRATGPLGGEVPLTGDLGDQQAATVGQVCFAPGEAKNTYGTGNFMLLNTGTELVRSNSGLLTTVCYKFGDEPAGVRAGGLDRGHRLGGAVAARPARHHRRRGGERDARRGRSRTTAASTSCRRSPACSRRTGAPTPAARSSGLSRFNTNAHLARATLEAICYQSRDVVEAMAKDSGVDLDVLKVDGGVTANDLCMQIQADVLGVPVSKPVVAETTALGAAYAAGLAVGLLEQHRRAAGELERGQALAAGVEPRSSATPATPAGRRRSSAHWTGWTSTSRPSSSRPRPKETRGPHGSRRTLARRTLRSTGRDGRGGARRARHRRRGRRRRGRAGRGHPGAAGRPGGGAGHRQRHVEPVQQADARRPALPGDARLRAGARGAAGARSASSGTSLRTSPGRCRSSTRCSTASGSGRTSGRGSCSTTRWPRPPRRVPRAGCRGTGT